MYARQQFVFALVFGSVTVLAAGGEAHGQPASPDGEPPPDATEASSPASSSGGDSDAATSSAGPAPSAAPSAASSTAQSPGPSTAIDAGPVAPAGPAQSGDEQGSLIEDDVAPTLRVFQSEGAELLLGGLVQMHFSPFVGNDSLLSNDDAATSEGFRLRRARIGAEGAFGDLRLLLVVNPLESDTETGTVSDARITFKYRPWARVSLGTTKVPFTRAGLESSRALSSIERPLAVRTVTPDRRLGITLEGEVLGQRVAYLAGFMNATEGYDPGNRYGGFLYGARVQAAAWGRPDTRRPAQNGLSVGLGAQLEDGPSTTRLAGAADILLAMARAVVKVEVLYDRQTPKDDPITSPMISDEIERFGGYVEVGYTLPQWDIQPVARIELFDDDRNFEDAGDVILFSVGANARLYSNTRLQLHYIGRMERHGEERSNDSVILNVQGEL